MRDFKLAVRFEGLTLESYRVFIKRINPMNAEILKLCPSSEKEGYLLTGILEFYLLLRLL